MVTLMMESESSDCLAVEQMLSSVSSTANRPLGTHHPSLYSLPTSHCIVTPPIFVLPTTYSTLVVLLHLFQWLLSFLYLLRIDYHFVPMIAQFGRTMTFCLLDCRRLIRFWPNLLLWKKGKKKQIDDPLQTLGGKAGGIDKKTVDTELLWTHFKSNRQATN